MVTRQHAALGGAGVVLQIHLELIISYGLTLVSAWISNYIHYKAWSKITLPSPNFNGYTGEVLEWIGDLIPHFTGYAFTYPWD